jgi:hypothetical protein
MTPGHRIATVHDWQAPGTIHAVSVQDHRRAPGKFKSQGDKHIAGGGRAAGVGAVISPSGRGAARNRRFGTRAKCGPFQAQE